jgi:CBS domain-containing membrane protein
MNAPQGEIRVADLMTRAVYTLSATQSLPLAESMMKLARIRHVPVVDDEGAVVGLVTHRDLLAAKISRLTPLGADERTTLELGVPVFKVMQTNVWTIAPDALAVTAARILQDHRFGCLPVVEGGRLVGIVTEADLLALVTDSLSLVRRQPWTAERAMTPVPVSVDPTTTLARARELMNAYRVRHLPIVQDGRAFSMISERDLRVAELVFHASDQTAAARAVGLVGATAARRVPKDTPLEDILAEMFRNRLDAVLVVDGERLSGILAASDACRILGDRFRGN